MRSVLKPIKPFFLFKPFEMSNAFEMSGTCRTSSYGEGSPSPFEMSVAETMMEHNLQLKEVSSDGNCFFASLVICLSALGQKTSMTALRNRFADHLAARVDELAPFFDTAGDTEEDQRKEFLAAVKKIRQSRFWDHQIIDLVVGCATEVLKMNVTVFDIDSDGNVTEYEHVYEPEGEPEGKVWPVVKMLRQDDNHFNAFVPCSE